MMDGECDDLNDLNDLDLWQEYEYEKEQLRNEELPWSEYQRRLREIADKLGV